MQNFFDPINNNPEKIRISREFGSTAIADTVNKIATNLRWCRVLGVSPQSVISNPTILAPLVGSLSQSFHNTLVNDRLTAFALRDSFGKEWFSDGEIAVIEALTGNWKDSPTTEEKQEADAQNEWFRKSIDGE